jgi:hypothetical protein
MTQLKDLSGSHKVTTRIPVAGATAGTDFEVAAFRAPFNLTITAARYLPNADLTGVTATEATLAVVNKGALGAGTAVAASVSFDDDTDAVDFIPLDLTLGAGVNVDAGHVVTIRKTHTSTGLALSGDVEIEFVNRGA